jgi:hypothetical protein
VESGRPRPRGKAGREDKGRGKFKKAHVKNTRKIRKYNKMDARNENIQNNVNERETNKSENAYVEEGAVCIFCRENFLNSASVERRFRFMSFSKWAHEKCAGVDPLNSDDFICEGCSSWSSLACLR